MIKIETKQGKTVTNVKGDITTLLTELVIINADVINRISSNIKISKEDLLEEITNNIKSQL